MNTITKIFGHTVWQQAGLVIIIFSATTCRDADQIERNFPRIHTKEITEISADGASLTAELAISTDETILDWGFVWDNSSELDIESSERKVIPYKSGQINLNYDVSSTLIANQPYKVKAFIRTPTYLVYGNEQTFLSQGSKGPVILEFRPDSAHVGDVLSINGDGFSNKLYYNSVSLNDMSVELLQYCDTLLTVEIPTSIPAGLYNIRVSVAGKMTQSSEALKILNP